ncbi:hypothetical protein DEDE109153_15255 [Deinococcus deserti]
MFCGLVRSAWHQERDIGLISLFQQAGPKRIPVSSPTIFHGT